MAYWERLMTEEKKRPLISLVLIVKDEVKTLQTCIDSVKSIVDEYVIVDTGSTDGTQEIIKKVGVLYEKPFTNFVEMKNYACSLATGEYILLLDADKTITSGLEFIKEHIATNVECLYADVIEPDDYGNVHQTYLCALLWKNNGDWKFEGPGVHEVIVGSKPTFIDHRIKVTHRHLHRDRDYYMKRFESYIVILNDYLKDHPDDPRGRFYLGRTLMDLTHWMEAITQFKYYLKLKTNYRDECWQAAHDIAKCWAAVGEFDKCLEACDLAESIDPRRADIPYMRGQVAYERGEMEEALKHFEKAKSLPIPQDIILFLNPFMHFEAPIDHLVIINNHLKNYRKAHDYALQQMEHLKMPDIRIMNNAAIIESKANQRIFFLLGDTPEPVYGGMLDTHGVGGLETTYLELPAALAKRGHDCYVFCKCDTEHRYEGVWYIPTHRLMQYASWKPDVLVSSRWYDPFYIIPDAKKIIWMQDNFYSDPNHADVLDKADRIICSSKWHRDWVKRHVGIRPLNYGVKVIPLAVRAELFKQPIIRNPLQVIYSSNPNRGLNRLKEYWQELSDIIPGIHLTVTYGWQGLSTWSKDPKWQAEVEKDKEDTEAWAKAAGNVNFTGRLVKKELAKVMLNSSLSLYPTNFWETFCLTALENQAAGVPTVTTNIGALQNTLCPTANVLINETPGSDEYRKIFINSTAMLLKNPDILKSFSEKCIAHFEQQPDWDEVAEMWEDMFYHL
jgi:glycosyltransferase involved in cell wall biosynthesis